MSAAAADAASDAGTSEPSASEASTIADSGEPAGPVLSESEPNGGELGAGGEPETNAMTVPGSMRGAIDPADDADIFTVGVKPGELWRYTLRGESGSAYVPHVTVFDTAENNLNPTQLAKAAAKGYDVTLEHFVLRPGKFVAAVRDARNVPAASSEHAGGSDVKYTLAAQKVALTPTPVTLPATVSGDLPSVSSVAVFSFSTTKNTELEIVLKAARKSAPSELDSRMSLFHVGTKKAILTNDNAGGATKDSEIRGPMPEDGEYYVIVENEADMLFEPGNTPDLSFDLEFSLK